MKKVLVLILIIILAVPVVLYFAFPDVLYNISIKWERKSAGLETKAIKLQDHLISYLEGGKGETILLLHGFSANKDNWGRFAKYLTKNYHVVAPDLPGFGESSKINESDYNSASQVLRVDQFVCALDLTKFHIAGNSMGGSIAGRYAIHFPEKVLSLGLFNTGGVFSCNKSEMTKLLEQGKNPLLIESPEDYDKMLSFVFVKPPFIPRPVKSYLIKKSIVDKPFNEKIIKDLFEERYSLESDLSKIKANTLILWGDTDRLIDVSCTKPLEKGLLNSKTVIIKNCGHLPMLEKPEETAKFYLEFIKQNKKG